MSTPADTLDAVALASQMGRLDLASLLLTVVALILAILVLPIFRYMAYRAEKAGRDEVRTLSANLLDRVEAEAISKVEEMLPILVEQYAQIAQNSVTPEQADDIAEAQDDPVPNDVPKNQGSAEPR